MTYKRGTVKLFTFSFETDAPNIISCAPKIFSCAPKNLHLVAQVLPNSNLNFEPCIRSYMLHIPNSAEGNCFNRKRKPQTMSEKRHKINKFTNYENIIVRNIPTLDHHVFVPSSVPSIWFLT